MKRSPMRKMAVLALTCVWLATMHSANDVQAQVNIEELRLSDESSGLSGSLAFEIESRTGNTDIQELGIEGRLQYSMDRSTTFLLVHSDFGWEQGQRFANEGLVHLRENYRIGGRTALEVFVQYNYDKTYLLDLRTLVGAGPRIGLIRSGPARLWYGTAYMLEYERLGGLPAKAAHPAKFTTSRWSNYLSSRMSVSSRVASAWTVYIQPRITAPEDVRVLSDVNLEVELGGPLSLVLSFAIRYDSRPPIGVRQYDTTIENSLAVVF